MKPSKLLRRTRASWAVFVVLACSAWPTNAVAAAEPDFIGKQHGLVFLGSDVATAARNQDTCVVLVPGLLASDHSMASIGNASQKQAFTTAIFRYTSQDGILAAAEQLSKELIQLKSRLPHHKVVVVTHSMGGLVARKCLEDSLLAPGNVSQLIMIAPPNQGSAIAKLTAAEIADDFRFKQALDAGTLSLVDDALGSFFGRAKDDLQPGSVTLAKLNACQRAMGIRYCIIAGDAGPIPGEWVSASLLVGGLLFGDEPDAAAAIQSAGKLLTLDEWTQGRGDGVVSVASTRLTGVDDFITLPFTHNSFGDEPCEATDSVLREVMKRVALSR